MKAANGRLLAGLLPSETVLSLLYQGVLNHRSQEPVMPLAFSTEPQTEMVLDPDDTETLPATERSLLISIRQTNFKPLQQARPTQLFLIKSSTRLYRSDYLLSPEQSN